MVFIPFDVKILKIKMTLHSEFTVERLCFKKLKRLKDP